jgi:hypothetical protein
MQIDKWFDRLSGIKRRPLIAKADFEAAITGRKPAHRSKRAR